MPLRNVSNIKKIFSEAKQRRESKEKEEEQQKLNRELKAQRRRESTQASEKFVNEILLKALIAAGEGCYQLLIPKLKRYERQRLSSLGLSTRTLGDEQDFLDRPYTKIYRKSLVVAHYSQEAESFFDWLADELGLYYNYQEDKAVQDHTRGDIEANPSERILVFDQITYGLELRQSTDKRILSSQDNLDQKLFAINVKKIKMLYERLRERSQYRDLPLMFLIPEDLRKKTIQRCETWLPQHDINFSDAFRRLGNLIAEPNLNAELSVEDHYLARRVKKKCHAWCTEMIFGDVNLVNSWVVSWWELLFVKFSVKKTPAHQLVWLSSESTQSWLSKIEEEIESAAMRELKGVELKIMDTDSDLKLSIEGEDQSQLEILCRYFEALGYTCTPKSGPYRLAVRWL